MVGIRAKLMQLSSGFIVLPGLLLLGGCVFADFTSNIKNGPSPSSITSSENSSIPGSKRPLKFDEALSGLYNPREAWITWTTSSSEPDGTYIYRSENETLVQSHASSFLETIFVDARDVDLEYEEFYLQPSLEHVMFAVNKTKLHRHSFLADYYVYNRKEATKQPLMEDQRRDIQ